MKIQKISKKDKEKLIILVKNNLVHSVIFNLPNSFIKKYFFNEIINNDKYLSLICTINNQPAGMIIIKKKNCKFSIRLCIATFFYCLITFFSKDIKIFNKFFFILFKKIKLDKKNYNILMNSYAEIIYICVDKKYRNYGVGSKLIKKSINSIFRNHKFLVTSSENSKEAINFYMKNGFKKFGLEKRFKKNNILLFKTL